MAKFTGPAARYYREVAAAIPYDRKRRRRYLTEFRSSLEAFTQEFPNATADQLQEKFGTPENLALDCLAADPLALSRRVVRMNRLLHWTVGLLIAVALLSAITAGVTVVYYFQNRSLFDRYFIESVTVYETTEASPEVS